MSQVNEFLKFPTQGKPVIDIYEWKIIDSYGESYLVGTIGPGHPRMPEGSTVRTSNILSQDKDRVETMNTIYLLKPSGVA